LDHWEAAQVTAARGCGWNWAEIGRVLGRSRQAVYARYRAPRELGDGEAKGTTTTADDRWSRTAQLLEQKLHGEITEADWLRHVRGLARQS
jgi:hypothetical protein